MLTVRTKRGTEKIWGGKRVMLASAERYRGNAEMRVFGLGGEHCLREKNRGKGGSIIRFPVVPWGKGFWGFDRSWKETKPQR